MEARIEQIPQSGKLDLTIHVSAPVNYSAEAARRIVGRFVANEISYLLRTGQPALVVGEQICWRVPVVLALPQHGEVGQVGSVDVAVDTGAYDVSSEQIQEMVSNADERAARYPDASGTAS